MKGSPTFLLVLMACSAASAQVHLRGGEVVEAPVRAVTAQGVEVGGDAPRLISWDRVREVEGEFAEDADAYAIVAEQAWRARTRLSRGDIVLAQPLFETLFETYRDAEGPFSLLIAEGLLTCRLAHMAQASAVEPWLAAARLRRAGYAIAGERPGESPLDPETLLAPQLPPLWLEGAAVAALAESAPNMNAPGAALAQLYRLAAAQAEGAQIQQIGAPDDGAVALVSRMIAATGDDASGRAEARQWLRAGLSRDEGTWREAWRRAAIGRSLLREPSIADQRRGMIQLLHIPARFGETQRYLSGVALALVADALRTHDDEFGAAQLQDELIALDPAHPALQWLNRRRIEQANATGAAKAAHKERS